MINTNISESVLHVPKVSSSIENKLLNFPCRSLYKTIEYRYRTGRNNK